MKTSDVFKVSYGLTLGFMCAKFTMSVCCSAINKLCDIGIDKIDKVERNRKVNYKPYYTNEKNHSYSIEETDICVKVRCAQPHDLFKISQYISYEIDNYGFLSLENLKDFAGLKYDYTDVERGWVSKDSYHINQETNTITFDSPIDVSDLVYDADKDIEEEEKEDEVEASE